MTQSFIKVAMALIFSSVLASKSVEPIAQFPLWPGTAPGDTGIFGPEKDTTKPADRQVANKSVIRIGNVTKPALFFYPAAADKNTGAAVLVCPGGGYNILAMDLEGTEVVEWLNSIGVNAFLLKYRVPVRKGRERYEPPLQDAQRAMGIIRHRARQWNVNSERIGVMGFSAGAHLSAVLSVNYGKRSYEVVDEADKNSCRPDFVMLIYPAYLTDKDNGDKIVPELPVSTNVPPTFLVQTQDDGVRVESSLFYYLALKNAKVPVEMHLYPSGGHGYGLRASEEHAVTTWPLRAQEWMDVRGILGK